MDILLLHLIKKFYFFKKIRLINLYKKYFFFIYYFLAGQPANPQRGGLTYLTQITNADWPILPRLKLDLQRDGVGRGGVGKVDSFAITKTCPIAGITHGYPWGWVFLTSLSEPNPKNAPGQIL